MLRRKISSTTSFPAHLYVEKDGRIKTLEREIMSSCHLAWRKESSISYINTYLMKIIF